jgi:predicted nucleic acid-binding Zn ribbon protein
MRFYTYRCTNGHKFERHEPVTAPTTTKCDECQAEAVRIIPQTYVGNINEIKKNWGRKNT